MKSIKNPPMVIIEMDTVSKEKKTSYGVDDIMVPRDRYGSFEPVLVPKRHNIIEGLENVITSFYAK